MTIFEEAEAIARSMSPTDLRELLDEHVVLNEDGEYILLREQCAKHLLSISRNPAATKNCRARALHAAKQYLHGFESELQTRTYREPFDNSAEGK
jgi:hypothetical protein